MSEQQCLTYARGYAAWGWPVLPLHGIVEGRCTCGQDCGSPGKHPIAAAAPHGLKDATVLQARVEEWWSRYPYSNVGIRTGAASGLLALDIDPRHGGWESLSRMEQEHGKLPSPTPTVHTGSGGMHLYLTFPGGGNRTDIAGYRGIDLRGDQGYVVAPPSTHVEGVYRWSDAGFPGDGVKPAACPPWLVRLLATPLERSPGPRGERLPAVIATDRNIALTRIAGAVWNHCAADADALEAIMATANQWLCAPPLPANEVARLARSVAARQASAPRPISGWLHTVPL